MENITNSVVTQSLTLNELWKYELLLINDNSIKVNNIIIAIVLAFLGIKLSGRVYNGLGTLFQKATNDKDTSNALHKISSYALFVLYIFTILEIANVPLNIFAFIGGALAISAGLGAQQLLNNIISGFLIILEKPIKIGDVIQVKDIVGQVLSIGGRSTIIKQIDGPEIVIPNSTIMQNHLHNWNYSNKNLSLDIIIKVEYPEATTEKIKSTSAIVKKHKQILEKITKAANIMQKIFKKTNTFDVTLIAVNKNVSNFLLSIEIQKSNIHQIIQIKDALNFALIETLDVEFSVQYPSYLT